MGLAAVPWWRSKTSQRTYTARQEISLLSEEKQRRLVVGPHRNPPSAAREKIIELFEETPAFRGLHGFEAGM